MFQFLYEWVKQIAVYMILVTMILRLLPNNCYKIYIKFYCGLLLILQLLEPIFNLFGGGIP